VDAEWIFMVYEGIRQILTRYSLDVCRDQVDNLLDFIVCM